MKQYNLAERIGVDKSTVSRWEGGDVRPSFEELFKMADEFGVSIDYILGRTDWEIDISKVDPDKRKLIEEYIRFIGKR